MKSWVFGIVLGGVSLCAASAMADRPQWSNRFQQSYSRSNFVPHFDAFKHHHKPPHNMPIPIDPGMGNGRPLPTNPTPTMPGYVWVNGHWERERAPTPILVNPNGPIVRDHRNPAPWGGNASGGVVVTQTPTGPIVRDHRTQSGPIIRDHR